MFNSIRHVKCHVLISPQNASQKCPICIAYDASLRKILSRQISADVSVRANPKSRMNDRWRTPTEMKTKMTRLRNDKRLVKERLKRLEAVTTEMIQKDGITVCLL